MKGTLTHKGYSRMYLENMADVDSVKSIIKEIDDFEYKYMPEDWFAPYSEYPRTVYHGKFSDMNMDLLVSECWKVGIRCWVFDGGTSFY